MRNEREPRDRGIGLDLERWSRRVERDTEKGLSGEGSGVFAVDDKPFDRLDGLPSKPHQATE